MERPAMTSERSGPNRPCGLTTPPSFPSGNLGAGIQTPQSIARSILRIRSSRSLPIPIVELIFDTYAGDQSVGATLVPIPNTIVKPYSADGTPIERARESRPSPAPFHNAPATTAGALCFKRCTQRPKTEDRRPKTEDRPTLSGGRRSGTRSPDRPPALRVPDHQTRCATRCAPPRAQRFVTHHPVVARPRSASRCRAQSSSRPSTHPAPTQDFLPRAT